MKQKGSLPFWIVTLSISAALILPELFKDGMFMDGLLYTSVSKNMAEGRGTFWFPVFSKYGQSGLTTFHEHPPLGLGIIALFFRVFGKGFATERIYVLFSFLLNTVLVNAIWRQLNRGGSTSSVGWLPVLLWVITPLSFWAFSNNMLENTMSIFILLSVWMFLKQTSANRGGYGFLLVSGLCVFLASFTKGLPGLFPLALPLIHWVCFRKVTFWKMGLQTAVMVLLPVAIYLVLFCLPASSESLSPYLFKRLSERIAESHTVGSRIYTLRRLLPALAVPGGITLFVLLADRLLRKKKPKGEEARMALFFGLLGIAGSLPLMLTMVQRAFYIAPSLPFYALAFAFLIAEPMTRLECKLAASRIHRLFTVAMILIFGAVVTWSSMQWQKPRRDREILHDVHLIGATISEHSIISTTDELWQNWNLQCYLMRYFDVSLSQKRTVPYEYLMLKKGELNPHPELYTVMNINLLKLELYKRKNP